MNQDTIHTINLKEWRASRKSIIYRSKLYGIVKLKNFITLGDLQFFLSLLEEKDITSKEFTVKILSHFTVQKPTKDFFDWDDLSILRLARKWAYKVIKDVNRKINGFEDFRAYISEHIKNTTKEMGKTLKKFSEQITETLKPMVLEIQKSLSSSLQSLTSSIASVLDSPGFQALRERLELDKATVEAFQIAGWVITPSVPLDLRRHVVELHKAEKTKFASQTIIGYYHRNSFFNLNKTVEKWQSQEFFTSRMHIIRDALMAHQRKEYTLSVPVIFTQLEGILNDFVKFNNLEAKLGKINDVYKVAIGDPKERPLNSWAIASSILYLLENNIYAYTDFSEEVKKPNYRRQVTRHTVLHGISTHYNTLSESLKVILILDAVYGLVLDFEKEQS